MTHLNITDILPESSYYHHPEVPAHINDVVFDVKEHIELILSDVLQKFKIIKTNGKEQPYSLADVRNFRDISITDLKKLFLYNFNLNLENKEDFNTINRYYQEAIQIIEKRYGREVETSLKHHVIRSPEDIKKMLDITGKWHKWVMICAISKLFLSLSIVNRDVRITEIDKIHSEITKEITTPLANLQEKALWYDEWEFFIDEKEKHIPIHFFHRAKSKESIVGKQMGNIDYNKVDDYKDLHGCTLEVDTHDMSDIILMLQQYYFMLLHKAKEQPINCEETAPYIKIENKALISLEDLENIQDKLDPNFYDFLKISLSRSEVSTKNKQKEKWSGDNYKDIKITLDYKTNDPRGKHLASIYSGIELKFIKKENNNEHGLSFHGIFDYKKRFREMTRIFGFIHHEDILFFVNNFFENINEKLLKHGKHFDVYMNELVADIQKKDHFFPENFQYIPHDHENMLMIKKWLYQHFLKEVVEVKLKKSSKHTFFVHKSYFDLTPEIQPDLEVIKK